MIKVENLYLYKNFQFLLLKYHRTFMIIAILTYFIWKIF